MAEFWCELVRWEQYLEYHSEIVSGKWFLKSSQLLSNVEQQHFYYVKMFI